MDVVEDDAERIERGHRTVLAGSVLHRGASWPNGNALGAAISGSVWLVHFIGFAACGRGGLVFVPGQPVAVDRKCTLGNALPAMSSGLVGAPLKPRYIADIYVAANAEDRN